MYFIYKNIPFKKLCLSNPHMAMFILPALPDTFKTISLFSKETSISIPVGFNHQDDSS